MGWPLTKKDQYLVGLIQTTGVYDGILEARRAFEQAKLEATSAQFPYAIILKEGGPSEYVIIGGVSERVIKTKDESSIQERSTRCQKKANSQ